jgi:alanine dehydrogenase
VEFGAPQEVRNHENYAGLTHACVLQLAVHGHGIGMQIGAAAPIGLSGEQYVAAGARIVFDADMIAAGSLASMPVLTSMISLDYTTIVPLPTR